MVPETMPTPPTMGEAKFSDATVLVVDDNEQNLELLAAYLETLGCRTVLARNGLEALEQVSGCRPDLILLDIMMPKMSGFEVCRKLKADPATRSIPVIMVTALNELGDIERAVECGTDDFLSKPIHKQELLVRVRSMLRIRHLHGQLERTLSYINDMEGRRPGSPPANHTPPTGAKP